MYLSTDLIRELKHHAVDTGQSLSGLVTDALRQYLAKAAGNIVEPEGG
ncbi:ribbon-helix-helix domain-containing protein [Amycolatopsis sp. cmx-4-54]